MDIETYIFPLLAAAVVFLFIWGISQLLSAGGDREKRKLAERLSTDMRGGGSETISEQFRPILRPTEVVGLPPALARHPIVQSLNRKLIQALPGARLGTFLAIAAGMGFFTLMIAYAVGGSVWVSLIAGAVATYAPFFWLSGRRSKRQRQMADQLPEALDFLSRILRAGHSFSTGLQMMSEELPMPLAGEFRRCYDQHSLGQSLEESLKDTAGRVDNTDFAFFVTALLIQRQTGGDLSEVLGNISNMIRGRLRLAQQVRSKTAEGRFTGYILVAFPAVMFALCYTQNPEYCNKLLHGTGLYFLGTAFGLQMLGLFTIRRITTVKV